ncbi:type II toxin-antitoxin system VapC family toxin [Corynebacterium jeddahense]|uniref:Ribonuclease VapC n=1 Tax=Corynebacterium jeddahense TaxID=1414719 RepID=A0ABY7UJA4_9CORY|nr:type II toxin-antitoxin system VapC family toxin [Corynebacterium jeddahense]WCZ38547.1 Toxin FitB [Corynebacterium jeddahense]
MYLLDTNVLSELQRRRPNPAVMQWFDEVPEVELFTSTITILEIEIGVLRLRHRGEGERAELISSWLRAQVIPTFAARILHLTAEGALREAQMHVPDPAPERDAQIAAIAAEHGLTVVTRNEKDFRRLGVPVFNPFGATE